MDSYSFKDAYMNHQGRNDISIDDMETDG